MEHITLLEKCDAEKFAVFRLSCDINCAVAVGILKDGRLSIGYKGDVKIVKFNEPKD